MPLRYLLDTNTTSYAIKGNIPRVRERLRAVSLDEVAVSVVTEAELRFGVARHPESARLRAAVDTFLSGIESLPWDSDAAHQYATVRATVESRGEPVGNLDLMIAAHALALGVVLVTSDKVFRRIKLLQIEDWTK